MATVNYLYRSTRNESNLNLRLLFKDTVIGGKTKTKVSREYWNKIHGKRLQDIKDIKERTTYQSVNDQLAQLEGHILGAFDNANPATVDKEWLKGVIAGFYDPVGNDSIPKDFVGYIDYYLDYKKANLTAKGIARINVTKSKMKRLQENLGKPILISEINEDFKKEFQDYSNQERYSKNTQQRELVLIKTICYHARSAGLETHRQLDGLKLPRQSVNHIYLDPRELETIEDVSLPHEHLENARDWLLISCHTGQRVSDFMRFNTGMIRTENGKHLLEFRQQKTKKLMTIPLPKKVRAILEKRAGEFPRKISDQKYNDYIKDVAEAAGLNEVCEGKRRINIANKGEKAKYRDVSGRFKKWELVSSHVGRRSFATNYYGKVPTPYLIGITGHGSEKMFLNYIKKSGCYQ